MGTQESLIEKGTLLTSMIPIRVKGLGKMYYSMTKVPSMSNVDCLIFSKRGMRLLASRVEFLVETMMKHFHLRCRVRKRGHIRGNNCTTGKVEEKLKYCEGGGGGCVKCIIVVYLIDVYMCLLNIYE